MLLLCCCCLKKFFWGKVSAIQSDRTTAAAVGAKLTKIGKDIEAAERAHGAAASTLSSEAQIRKLMKF